MSYKTTKELEQLGLYYVKTDLLNIEMYYKSKKGNFFKKTIRKNPYAIEYITHQGSNYALNNISINISENKPLLKGISAKYSKRKRVGAIIVENRIITIINILIGFLNSLKTKLEG